LCSLGRLDWALPHFTPEVYWAPLDPAPLPDEMVKKYNGTSVAIVGWEIDQVRRTPSGDVSVPISASYNHHYTSTMIGAGARFEKIMLDGPDDPRAAGLDDRAISFVLWPRWITSQSSPDHYVWMAGEQSVCSNAR
jgi:hypothetical protein